MLATHKATTFLRSELTSGVSPLQRTLSAICSCELKFIGVKRSSDQSLVMIMGKTKRMHESMIINYCTLFIKTIFTSNKWVNILKYSLKLWTSGIPSSEKKRVEKSRYWMHSNHRREHGFDDCPMRPSAFHLCFEEQKRCSSKGKGVKLGDQLRNQARHFALYRLQTANGNSKMHGHKWMECHLAT